MRRRSLLFVCLITMAILLLPFTAVMAYQVQLSDGVGTDGGGMFGVHNADTPYPHTFLFNTFCLERNEFINFGTHYDFTIDTAAIQGGIGGGSPDPISADTAFLYYTFRTNPGLLGIHLDNIMEVTAFQYAIWSLENELTSSIPNDYLATANSYLAYAAGKWSDIHNVRVMNLTYTVTNPDGSKRIVNAQSMLTLLPVPEPSALILLGLGMFGIGVASRKLKK